MKQTLFMRYLFLLSLLFCTGCKISCENLPVKTEIMVLPIRVEPTPTPVPDEDIESIFVRYQAPQYCRPCECYCFNSYPSE